MNEHSPPVPGEVAGTAASDRLLPVAPADPSRLAAAETARRHLEALERAARQQRQEAYDAIERDLLAPLRKSVRRVANRHARLTAEAGLNDGADAPPGDVWDRLLAYRAATGREVLQALQHSLTTLAPGERIGAAFLNLLEALPGLAADVPALVTLPEPPDLHAPDPRDTPAVRLKKRILRGRDALRRLGLRAGNGIRRLLRRPLHPLPARDRQVPLAALCEYHLRVRLAGLYLPAHEHLQQHVARQVARLEAAVAAWTDTLLEIEALRGASLPGDPSGHPARPRWPDWALPAPPPAPDRHPDEAAHHRALRLAREAAATLQDGLQALAGAEPPASPFDEAELQAAGSLLARDVRYAGTMLLDPGQRRLPEPAGRPDARLRDRQRRWAAWHTQARNRIEAGQHLVALYHVLLHAETGLLQETAQATLVPVFERFTSMFERLRAAIAQVEALPAGAGGEPARLAEALRTLQEATLADLQASLADLPGVVASDQALLEPGARIWKELLAHLDTLPEELEVHPLPAPDHREDPPVQPGQRTFRINLRELAGQALPAPYPERLHAAAEPLRQKLVRTWRDVEGVLHIVQYNLEAALDELDAQPGEKTDADDRPHDPVATACDLAAGGLRRAANTLAALVSDLREPWQAYEQEVFRTFARDRDLLLRQVRAAGAPEAPWVELLARLRRGGGYLYRRTRTAAGQLAERTRLLFRLGRRHARELRQQAQTVVGIATADAEAQARTLDALTHLAPLQERLPLIYRKLFALAPLAEPFLLENRTHDLEAARRHFERWRQGRQGEPLIVVAPPGAGRTSFLNVLPHTVLQPADVRPLALERRLTDPAALAQCLAGVLELDLDAPPSLEALEAALLARTRTDPPVACLIDNLEHLMLRTLNGTDLLERLLILFARTDGRIYWVATINAHAWHYLGKVIPSTTGLASVRALTPFDRDTLETLILSRHRRSGMPLRFIAPEAHPRRTLPRLLRRSRTDEEQQAALRRQYFDRLHRSSGQNLRLALFYWLRSADFEADGDTLTIRPLEPLDFGFLNTYDLGRAFSLNAFLLHGTLTLDEHNRIFRLSEEEGILILESLLNQRVIEPVPAGRQDGVDASRIHPALRYRLHPLLLHPVTESLRARRIVY
ncbi:hypothetical protein GQ464_006025 [Rhodocaloribacter litoris]|uniref:hypothetical protein n=1 Tax=Rhodocaloribacter litoris TaxID=2558931 RepID=UPI00141EF113|nr:hypothetical protein [Rhodocaloribacter litoris]QXD16503.1 hypothetical protein GQ464_006025 [Rhodocaloribacter litoris]